MQKIGSLCASIEGEIKSVSTDNFAEIEGDIEALRQEARAKEGPEPGAEYASLLFRRFADEANYLKQNAPLAGGRKKGDVNRDEELGFGPAMSRLVDMIPEIVYKGTGQQLAGKEAFKYNIFW
jgi:hypothetical protein